MSVSPRRHQLQIPGPSPVPERIRRAMDRPVIDHRGPEFAKLGQAVLAGMKTVFNASGSVVIYPSSGTGAWEAALVNTLSPGDTVLLASGGHFAETWGRLAARLGIEVEALEASWRRPADPDRIGARLAEDRAENIKAVMVVQNETSTGVVSDLAAIRRAIDDAGHGALLLVDAVSALGSIEMRQDDWGVDVAVACSQKGLMLPPGLGFTSISGKALKASEGNGLRRSYWDWSEMLRFNTAGFFPYTPATNLLFGLREALDMLQEEGLEAVFERHRRLASATCAAADAWGLEIYCEVPAARSPVLTALMTPPGHDADMFRTVVLERFDMSLGSGLNRLMGKVFRIGHLGECDSLTLTGALAGIEMGLAAAGIPHRAGGVQAAIADLIQTSASPSLSAVA